MQSELQDKCQICSRPAGKKCTGCRLVSYCSVEHQKDDWKRHKKVCSPFVEKETEEWGLALLAARNIKRGQLILTESPLFYTPNYDADNLVDIVREPILQFGDKPLCGGCCGVMGFLRRCSNCKWPACGPGCEKVSQHADYECKLFKETSALYTPSNDGSVKNHLMISILRCLLYKQKNPTQWESFAKLDRHREERTRLQGPECFASFESVKDQLISVVGKEINIDDDEIKNIMGILNVNPFHLIRCEETETLISMVLFYEKGCKLGKSCIPNATWGTSFCPDLKLEVRAAVDIPKGEPITIQWGAKINIMGTWLRQESLRKRGLTCRCDRCLDPSEFGTYVQGVFCRDHRCGLGYLLPVDPFDPQSKWQCDRMSCGQLVDGEAINEFCKTMDVEVRILSAEASPTALDRFFEDNYTGTLHRSHFLMQEISRKIIINQAPQVRNLLIQHLERHIWHCENLLAVADKLYPGLTMERANIQYHLSQALLLKTTKILKRDGLNEENADSILEILHYCDTLQQSALLFYSEDPHTTPRHGISPFGTDLISASNQTRGLISAMKNKKDGCAICMQPGIKKCGGCMAINYCSLDHQRKHWKAHKNECTPWEISNGEDGDYLVAARKLPPRAFIFQETPLIWAPNSSEDHLIAWAAISWGNADPMCLGCSGFINENSVIGCIKCGWPVCGHMCQAAVCHTDFECKVFFESKLTYEMAKKKLERKVLYRSIMILRLIIFKEKDSENWKTLESLSQHSKDKIEKISIGTEKLRLIMKNLAGFYGKEVSDIDEEEVKYILAIINLSSLGCLFKEEGKVDFSSLFLLGTKTSMLNRACVPNAMWEIGPSPTFKVRVRSLVAIKPGEQITVAHSSKVNQLGTSLRQNILKKSGRDPCQCARCRDLTELGTYVAAVKCFVCKDGLLLPESPLDPGSVWKCGQITCEKTFRGKFVTRFVDDSDEEVKRSLDANMTHLDNLYNKLLNSFHPNHHVLQEISKAIAMRQANEILHFETPAVRRYIWHCENLIKIASKLNPGITYEQAIVQFYLARAKKLIAKNIMGPDDNPSQRSTKKTKEIVALMKSAEDLERQCRLFWEDGWGCPGGRSTFPANAKGHSHSSEDPCAKIIETLRAQFVK